MKKIPSWLRSAGPQSTNIRISFALVLIILYCCNPVKKVVNDPVKTQKVVNTWLKNNPVKNDTSIVYKPGDTVTQLLIAYDTTLVRDTISKTIEKIITKTNTITRTVHDTVQITTVDNKLLQACQAGFKESDNKLQQQKLATQAANLRADKWIFKFWILLAVSVVVSGIFVYLKFKP